MKIYKSFDEIRGKVWKNYGENITKNFLKIDPF